MIEGYLGRNMEMDFRKEKWGVQRTLSLIINEVEKKYYQETHCENDIAGVVDQTLEGIIKTIENQNKRKPEFDLFTCSITKIDGKIGLSIEERPAQTATIQSIIPQSAASNSDLRIGDVILSVNGKSTKGLCFSEIIQCIASSNTVEFQVHRRVSKKIPRIKSPGSSIQLSQLNANIRESSKLIKVQEKTIEALNRQNTSLIEKEQLLRRQLQQVLIEKDIEIKDIRKKMRKMEEERQERIDKLENLYSISEAKRRIAERAPSTSEQDTLISQLEIMNEKVEKLKQKERVWRKERKLTKMYEGQRAEKQREQICEQIRKDILNQMQQNKQSVFINQDGVRYSAFVLLFPSAISANQLSQSLSYSTFDIIRHTLDLADMQKVLGDDLCRFDDKGNRFTLDSSMKLAYDPKTELLQLKACVQKNRVVADIGRNIRMM